MLNKLKKNNKKGFTLVELIVVLVILAILAALLIPALTGYIDKAKEKQIIAETRQAVMAAQTLVDEEYAKSAPDYATNVTVAKIAELAELTETNIIFSANANIDTTDGFVKGLQYTSGGKTCTYDKSALDAAGTFEVN